MECFLLEKQQPHGYYKKMSEFHQTGREKLPYSSSSLPSAPVSFTAPSVSFTAPSVSEKAHIGDWCVFKFGLEWQLGRILQLFRYDNKV